jgi:DNA-binding MarR family transcriptional regulator
MTARKRTTGSLVWHLAMKWRAEVDRAIAHLGLTHAEYSVLACLDAMVGAGERPTQRELSTYAGLHAIYTSKLVTKMETGGTLSRSPDPVDARAWRLDLTAEGRAVVRAARDIVEALDRRLTQPIGGPDGERTRALAATLALLLDRSDSS